MSQRRETVRFRAADFLLLALTLALALGALQGLEHFFPAVSEFCKSAAVVIAAGLLGTALLRRRDALRREFAGRAEAQTRSILDAAVDAIITTDEKGIIQTLNPATTRLFGYSADQLVGQNVSVLMPEPYYEEHDGYIRRYLTSGEPHIIGIGREVVGRRADGRMIPLHLSVSEARIGSRRLFTGILRDLTEPRSAQAEIGRLGEILEQSLNELYVCDDRSLRFELVNRGARENLGYSLEEMEQLTPLDIAPEFTAESFEKLVAPLRSGEQKRAVFKTRHRRKDGSTYRVEVQLQHAEHAGVGRFVAISEDITEREALETQLAQAQKLEAIGQLAGGIAHDFNNLLTSIQGSSELLAERLPEGDRSQRALTRIRQAAERGAALTQKLLAFSRRQAYEAETLDLNAVITQVSELAGRLIGADIGVALDLQQKLHLVRADRTQLDQIALNLIVNSSDAMPRGGTLTLATRNLELSPASASRLGTDPGPAVELRVSDTGVGMNPEILGRIFEPFFTTKEIGKGTGLGLATVYGIVKQNGWGIEVESQPGAGSTFRVYLPRASGDTAVRPAAARREGPARTGETVLLVEDDTLLREMAKEILEGAGFHVVAAPDPETALAGAEQLGDSLALLISDVVMPQMTGPQLAARLRERWPDLRVLLMSGYADEALEARGALPGEIELLHKPFTNQALVSRIRAVLDAPPPTRLPPGAA